MSCSNSSPVIMSLYFELSCQKKNLEISRQCCYCILFLCNIRKQLQEFLPLLSLKNRHTLLNSHKTPYRDEWELYPLDTTPITRHWYHIILNYCFFIWRVNNNATITGFRTSSIICYYLDAITFTSTLYTIYSLSLLFCLHKTTVKVSCIIFEENNSLSIAPDFM